MITFPFHRIDILAVQEIADDAALYKVNDMTFMGLICTMVSVSVDHTFLYPQFLLQIKDELNNPTSELLKNYKSHGGHWECCTSDVAGYMFRVF